MVAISLLWAEAGTRTARRFKAIVDEQGGPGAVAEEQRLGHVLERLAREAAGSASAAREAVGTARGRSGEALEKAAAAGITLVLAHEPDYPALLWQVPDPPPVLWVLGRVDAIRSPAVAVVGARRATPSGLALAARLARELAEAGLAVVSGLARGVDGAAHAGALDAGGVTVAVLGSGVDRIYPAEHHGLARRICGTGAVISEFPPASLPLPWRFPLRNRIISGLSRAVVVIEASERSGSLITARAALEQGRDVLAVPGNVASGRYRGGHALIKDGARLVETVGDVLEEIGWRHDGARRPHEDGNKLMEKGLELLMVSGEVYSLDDLAARSGRRAPELLAELAGLELAGRVARVGGGNFTKT